MAIFKMRPNAWHVTFGIEAFFLVENGVRAEWGDIPGNREMNAPGKRGKMDCGRRTYRSALSQGWLSGLKGGFKGPRGRILSWGDAPGKTRENAVRAEWGNTPGDRGTMDCGGAGGILQEISGKWSVGEVGGYSKKTRENAWSAGGVGDIFRKTRENGVRAEE